MELQHFSHKHPLILNNEMHDDSGEKNIACKGCLQVITGSSYSCRTCHFSLHEFCAELPTQMNSPMHPGHPLTLLPQAPYSTSCDACHERWNGFIYHCSLCKFNLDISCAVITQTRKSTRTNTAGETELRHFSHKHPLILNNEKDDDGENFACKGCLQVILGSSYSCRNCRFFLHKLCAELPTEMKHPMHPEHRLTLLSQAPYYTSCDACEKFCKGFIYHCLLCNNFELDISCAVSAQSVEHKSHKHRLSPLLKPALFFCDACCTKHEGLSYKCNTCTFWIHEDCALLPTMIKHSSHVHPLVLVYSSLIKKFTSKFCCGICGEKLDRNSCLYHCGGCGYLIHVNCSAKTMGSETTVKVEDLDVAYVINLPVPNESANLVALFVEQIRQVDDKREKTKLNHFSHRHPLTLFNAQSDYELCSGSELSTLTEQKKNHKICDACLRQISTPFYSCRLCNFSLHKWCAELPNELQHPCHPHRLILFKKFPARSGVFRCRGCGGASNGFTFKCVECRRYSLDVECACLPSSIVHEVHEHPLFLRNNCSTEGCSACDRNIDVKLFSYECGTCNFNLHSECALLPRTVTHRYDEHPFTLTYGPIKDGPDEYYCEFCEEEMDPKWWFYHCVSCDQSACARCIYKGEKEYPNLKYGRT